MPFSRTCSSLAEGSGITRDLERREQPTRLGPCFSKFTSRLGVSNDSRARAELNLPAHQGHGADEDVEIHRAIAVEVAKRAGVGATPYSFELCNDLHTTKLRHPGDRTAGKHRAQRLYRCHVGSQYPTHVGNDVMHVSIGLDRHELIYPNSARLTHATQIVALEVNEHDVLRPLLRVLDQRRHLSDVISRSATSWSRSGDRTGIDPSS